LSYPQPEQNWLEVTLDQEIAEFSELLDKEKPDWIIVDHYSLGTEWEQMVKDKGHKLMVIDDIFREHVCAAVIDPNFHLNHSELWLTKIFQGTQMFLGPKYALLSKTFEQFVPQKSPPTKKAKNILAFFGGSDAAMMSEKFLEACEILASESFQITLLLGGANPRQDQLIQKSSILGVDCFAASSKVADLMCKADIYIGAGGGATWERCYFGIPAIAVSVAYNQEPLSKSLADLGAQTYLGSHAHLSAKQLAENWLSLAEDLVAQSRQKEVALSLQVSQGLDEIIHFLEAN
jgi:UDP-2,4-diacetamido-2,4,6-trideoxy-beta-L-altropyranose hydrolase